MRCLASARLGLQAVQVAARKLAGPAFVLTPYSTSAHDVTRPSAGERRLNAWGLAEEPLRWQRHRFSASWPRHAVSSGCRVSPWWHCLRLCRTVLRQGWLSSLPEPGEHGAGFGDDHAGAVEHEQQDGRIVECARSRGIRRDLACSPGDEGEHGHESQEAMPALGWSADADGRDGRGDEEQRGG